MGERKERRRGIEEEDGGKGMEGKWEGDVEKSSLLPLTLLLFFLFLSVGPAFPFLCCLFCSRWYYSSPLLKIAQLTLATLYC